MRSGPRNCGDSFRPRPAACSVRAPVAMSTDTMREWTVGLQREPARIERVGHVHLVEDDVPAVGRPLGRAAQLSRRRDPAQAAAVRGHDVDARRMHVLPASGRLREPAAAVGRERQQPPVGRPARPEVAALRVGQVADLPGSQIEDVDVGRAARPGRHEGELPAVGRQRRLVVEGGVVGQPLEAEPVRADPEDVGRAEALGREHDPLAVGRERRVVVAVGAGHELAGVAPVGVGDVQHRAGGAPLIDEDAFLRTRRRRAGNHEQQRRRQRALQGPAHRAVLPLFLLHVPAASV